MDGENIEIDKMMRDYAWKYFAMHAEQQLKTFNFYIALCAVIIGGFITMLTKDELTPFAAILPVLLVLISFLFKKLDSRTVMLIENGENALKYLDSQIVANYSDDPNVLALFKKDDENTSNKKLYPPFTGYFSYRRVFTWVFRTMGVLGIIGAIACFVE